MGVMRRSKTKQLCIGSIGGRSYDHLICALDRSSGHWSVSPSLAVRWEAFSWHPFLFIPRF